MRIAHLGPAGTFSEEAALLYDADADLVPYPTITGSARAVRGGNSDLAMCPIENSLQGARHAGSVKHDVATQSNYPK